MLFNAKRIHDLEVWTLLGFLVTLPFSKALANIFFVITAILWGLQCVLERRLIFPKTPLNLLILAFVLSLFLSFTQTPDLSLSWKGVRKIVERLALFFLTVHVLDTTARQMRFFKLLGFGILLVLVSGLAQLLFGQDFLRGRPIRFANQMPRLTSCFEFPDQYATWLIYAVFLTTSFVLEKGARLWSRIAFAFLSLGSLASLLMTHARAGWIAFATSVVFSTLFLKRAVFWFLAAVSLVVFFVLAAPSDLLVHKNAEGKEQSVSERFTLWTRAFEAIKHHPWTGFGINTYAVQGDRYATDDKANLARYYAHNSFLQMAAESGLVTTGLFILIPGSFLVLALVRLRRADEDTALILRPVTAGIFAFMVLNFFESSLFSVQPAQLFYFFLGVGTRLIMTPVKEREQ